MSDEYPLFIPPGSLREKTPSEYTKQEAKDYFRWLIETQESRIYQLLTRFEEHFSSPVEELLLRLGGKVAAALKTPTFSQCIGNKPDLTNCGYALAADMGLLLAALFMRECGTAIHWVIVTKPKSDVSFNCPVLDGFGKVLLNPILVSVSQSFGILRGDRGGDIWYKVFETWKTRADEVGSVRTLR